MIPKTKIACLGLSHYTAPVAIRERISCALPDQHHLLDPDGRGGFEALQEMVVLSTCNRIELYASIDTTVADPRRELMEYLATTHPVDPAGFEEHLYFHTGRDAVDHLAHVAAGLDSLVLGEPQILGQVTDAYMAAVDAKTIGPVLTALFRAAIRIGKRARAETAISSNPASISSVAISLAEQIVGDLQHKDVLVIGLGEMGQLALNALRKRDLARLALANRSRDRAERLAAKWSGTAYGLDDLPQALAASDVVISATGAPHAIMDEAMVAEVMARRPGRELVLIDIAVPRDVETGVRTVPGLHLFNMDDLQAGLDAALAARREEIPQVEAIIAEEITALETALRQMTIRPLISDLRQKAEAIRRQELERTLHYLGDDLDPETRKHVQHLSRSLVNKLLHEPTIRLRQKATNGQAADYAAAVRDLFDLSTHG